MSAKKYDGKHLTTTQRMKNEKGLMEGRSFAFIGLQHPLTLLLPARS